MLIGGEALEIQAVSLLKLRQGGFLLLFLLVPALLIDGGIACEFQAGGAGPEIVAPGLDFHRHAVIDRVGHLAGHKAAPDEPVEPVLLTGEVRLQVLRGPADIAGTDGFVGVLGARLGLVAVGFGVGVPVTAQDEALGLRQGLFGKAQRVRTHIGDEAHGALPGDVHALIELLGDGHGPPGSHAQFPGSLLLHSGGGKGGRGTPLLVGALHTLHRKGGVLRLPDHRVYLGLGLQFRLFPVLPVVAGGKGLVAAQEIGVQGPIFLRLEGFDLPFPVVHHPGGHGLNPPGGEAPADFFPQQGAQLIAHQPVQDAPGLLGVYQVLVNSPGGLNALLNHFLRNLVEGHPPGLLVRQIQKVLEVPGDGLPLPVRVGCQEHGVRRLGGLFQILDDIFLALDGLVNRLEILLRVHAQLALGQVPQVAHTGLDGVLLPQILSDGLGLRRGFHDDQILLCHSYLRILLPHPAAKIICAIAVRLLWRQCAKRLSSKSNIFCPMQKIMAPAPRERDAVSRFRKRHGPGIPLSAVLMYHTVNFQHG